MFDLERAIKQWQKMLRKNQAIEDGYLAEIESHLREEFENHRKKRTSPKPEHPGGLSRFSSSGRGVGDNRGRLGGKRSFSGGEDCERTLQL